jgi:hypothetical protein
MDTSETYHYCILRGSSRRKVVELTLEHTTLRKHNNRLQLMKKEVIAYLVRHLAHPGHFSPTSCKWNKFVPQLAMRIEISSKFVLEPPRVRQEREMNMRISSQSCPIRRKPPAWHTPLTATRHTQTPLHHLPRTYSLPRTLSPTSPPVELTLASLPTADGGRGRFLGQHGQIPCTSSSRGAAAGRQDIPCILARRRGSASIAGTGGDLACSCSSMADLGGTQASKAV